MEEELEIEGVMLAGWPPTKTCALPLELYTEDAGKVEACTDFCALMLKPDEAETDEGACGEE